MLFKSISFTRLSSVHAMVLSFFYQLRSSLVRYASKMQRTLGAKKMVSFKGWDLWNIKGQCHTTAWTNPEGERFELILSISVPSNENQRFSLDGPMIPTFVF